MREKEKGTPEENDDGSVTVWEITNVGQKRS